MSSLGSRTEMRLRWWELFEPTTATDTKMERLLSDVEWFKKNRRACKRDGPSTSVQPWSATFRLACAEGSARLTVSLSPKSSKIRELGLVAVGDAPDLVRTRAVEALKLVRRWSEKRFASTFAETWDPKRVRDDNAAVLKRWGSCKVASTEEFTRSGAHFAIDCEQGQATMFVNLTDDEPHRINGIRIRPREDRNEPASRRCR